MDKVTRIYKLHRLVARNRHGVGLEKIMAALECSRATASRVIQEWRDDFGAPLKFDKALRVYRLDVSADGQQELPGVWFNEQELLALLSLEKLLEQMGSRYLTRMLEPVRSRVESLLGGSEVELESIGNCIRVEVHHQRESRSGEFETVVAATLAGRQLRFSYHARNSNEKTMRQVSPQRLTHYRSNWYLDAWCHSRQDFRRFALDRIQAAESTPEPAQRYTADELSAALDGGYGGFTGPAPHLAVLRFQPLHARWAADERWHPAQTSDFLPDGRFELRVPYGEPFELLMDIQRYGAGVEVVSPPALREALRSTLQCALAQYLQPTP